MRELARIRMRTLGWFVMFPVTLLGLLPWWLHRWREGSFTWEGSLAQWLGIWLLVNGVGLGGWCVQLFNVEGRGTPLPWDAPRRFVVAGPYRFVRNPMALAVFLILAGQVAMFGSLTVLAYLLLGMVAVHLYVCFVEEPGLERRFGPYYVAYRQQVPRWLPRRPVAISQPRHRDPPTTGEQGPGLL